MKVFRRNRGMTLLETMLVVAVLAVISLGGFNLYQTKVEGTKVNNFINQLQFLISGSRNYYRESKSHWPYDPDYSADSQGLRALVGMTGTAQNLLNPWGNGYRFSHQDAASTSDNRQFSITTEVPKVSIAMKVRSYFPFLVYEEGCTVNCDVTLYPTVPSEILWAAHQAKIVKIDDVTLENVSGIESVRLLGISLPTWGATGRAESAVISHPACPEGRSPKQLYGLKRLVLDNGGGTDYLHKVTLTNSQISDTSYQLTLDIKGGLDAKADTDTFGVFKLTPETSVASVITVCK